MEYHLELAIVGPDETAGGQSQGEYAGGVALAQRGAFIDERAVLFNVLGIPKPQGRGVQLLRCPRAYKRNVIAAEAAGYREVDDAAAVSNGAHTWMVIPSDGHQIRGRMGAVSGQHERLADLVAAEQHAVRDARCQAHETEQHDDHDLLEHARQCSSDPF